MPSSQHLTGRNVGRYFDVLWVPKFSSAQDGDVPQQSTRREVDHFQLL
jgi:hypothetical protein